MYLLIITTLFLLLLLTIHRMILTHHRLRRHLPPGPYSLTTTIPFIGETLQLISAYKTENPEPFTDDRVSRFGSIFTTHLFGEPTVFSADPEINRFILGTEGKYFESSYPSSIQNLIGKHSLLLMRGGLHKRMHSLTMSFGNSSIIRDHLLVDIDRLIRMNLDSWVRGVDDDDTVTTNHGHVFLMEEAKKITFALTMKQLMSFDPCEWTESLRKEYLLVIEGFFSIPLPFFPTTYNRAIKARTKVVEALRLVVRQRRKESQAVKKDNSSNETRLKKKDMLGALLEEDQGGGGGGFTDEEIVDFLVALLVAGYETTSIIMTLAVKFLTETPMALAQLKEEQDSIRAKKKRNNNTEEESLTWNDYKSMPFTQCVVNETLRVANIIGGIFRRTTTDVQVRGGYTIPKGWKVFASFRAVHMNEDYYKDARSFYPWRWQTDDGEPTPTACPKSTVFTPFGGGPRLCPGYEIARVSISVFLHHLVTTYSWSPTEDDKLVFFPTTRTQKRYPIKVQKRHDIASSSLL